MKRREFLIKDIGCKVLVEEVSRKEVLSWLDNYLDNLQYDWFDGSDDSFDILYKDGSFVNISVDYDGSKIRRQNIESIVYNNACSSIVYGSFGINEYGVVTTATKEYIDNVNIEEIK